MSSLPTHRPKIHCPIACASSLIGDMWVILIVRDLLDGAKRFGDLQHSVISFETGAPINSKTLTDRLKLLEEVALVERKAFEHKKPPRVEYSLTAKGLELTGIIDELREFGEKHLQDGC